MITNTDMIVTGGHQDWFEMQLTTAKSPGQSVFDIRWQHSTPPQILDFQAAADYTARLIADRYDNLFLGLSGGLDSEFVADVLYRNKIPFTPIVGVDRSNRDSFFALEWCRKHAIKPIIFDWQHAQKDLFMLGKNWARRMHVVCDGIHLVLYLNKIAKERGGHLIIGEPNLSQNTLNFDDPITDVFDLYYFQLGMEWGGCRPGSFFIYTPELLLAQARELDCGLNDSSSRAKLYQVPYRPKIWINDYRGVASQSIIDAYGYFFQTGQYSEPTGCIWSQSQLINILENPAK